MRTAKGGEEPLGRRFHHEVTKPFYKKAHNISNIKTTIAFHGMDNLFLQIYFTYIYILNGIKINTKSFNSFTCRVIDRVYEQITHTINIVFVRFF